MGRPFRDARNHIIFEWALMSSCIMPTYLRGIVLCCARSGGTLEIAVVTRRRWSTHRIAAATTGVVRRYLRNHLAEAIKRKSRLTEMCIIRNPWPARMQTLCGCSRRRAARFSTSLHQYCIECKVVYGLAAWTAFAVDEILTVHSGAAPPGRY